MDPNYCEHCRKDVCAKRRTKTIHDIAKNIKYEYQKIIASCPNCHREIFDHYANDENIKNRKQAYDAQKQKAQNSTRQNP